MKAALMSVGTEILLGEITNTNVVYLSRELNTLGIDVMYHYTVGDNPERLAEMLEMAFQDCDLARSATRFCELTTVCDAVHLYHHFQDQYWHFLSLHQRFFFLNHGGYGAYLVNLMFFTPFLQA